LVRGADSGRCAGWEVLSSCGGSEHKSAVRISTHPCLEAAPPRGCAGSDHAPFVKAFWSAGREPVVRPRSKVTHRLVGAKLISGATHTFIAEIMHVRAAEELLQESRAIQLWQSLRRYGRPRQGHTADDPYMNSAPDMRHPSLPKVIRWLQALPPGLLHSRSSLRRVACAA